MNHEWPVLLLNDGRLGMRAHFQDIGDIGVVLRVIRHFDGSEEFIVDLGNCCRLCASSTHFELVKD